MSKLILPSACSLSKLLTGLLLIFFTISGCKKGDINSAKQSLSIKTENNIADKVWAYLESQKITAVNAGTRFTNKNSNIDLLKET